LGRRKKRKGTQRPGSEDSRFLVEGGGSKKGHATYHCRKNVTVRGKGNSASDPKDYPPPSPRKKERGKQDQKKEISRSKKEKRKLIPVVQRKNLSRKEKGKGGETDLPRIKGKATIASKRGGEGNRDELEKSKFYRLQTGGRKKGRLVWEEKKSSRVSEKLLLDGRQRSTAPHEKKEKREEEGGGYGQKKKKMQKGKEQLH